MAHNQPHSATICWSKDHEVLQYKRYQIKISRLTGGVMKMLEDLLKRMHALSGGAPIKINIPEDHVDDLSSTGRGLSWLQGCHTEPRDHALMHAMVREGLWNLSVVNERGELSWNRVSCERFMAAAAEIVDRIMTLVHLGSGPPLRGEELIRDQISNGLQPRTIYLVFGQIMAIRRRSKDTNVRGIDSFNICYFPRSLTNAICYYLLVIRPLERVIAWQLYKDRKRCMEYDLYLYVKHGQRVTSAEFSETLSNLTGEYTGVKLSIQPMRHIMVAFQRAFVEPKVVDKGNNIGDLLSSHNSRTADRFYAREYDDLEGATSGYLLDVQDWCELFHDAIGLGERTGPLVPLRTKRKVAQQLVALTTMDSADALTTNVIADVFKRLGETAYRAGLQELKSHVVQEVWDAVGNGFEKIVSNRGLFPIPATTSSMFPSPITPRPNCPLDTRAPPDPPVPFRANARKRQLSQSEDPVTKRRQASIGRYTQSQHPALQVETSLPEDTQLEYASDLPEEVPRALPNLLNCRTVPLPPQGQNEDNTDRETIQRLSSLAIEETQDQHPPPQDHILIILPLRKPHQTNCLQRSEGIEGNLLWNSSLPTSELC